MRSSSLLLRLPRWLLLTRTLCSPCGSGYLLQRVLRNELSAHVCCCPRDLTGACTGLIC
jgi:hypothetical protein